jgi:hypothetical protein
VLAALIADHANQIGPRKLQITLLAEFVQLLQVNARHRSTFMTTAFKQLWVNWPSPIGELQPINAAPVFNAVNFWRRSKAATHPPLSQLDQPFAAGFPRAS